MRKFKGTKGKWEAHNNKVYQEVNRRTEERSLLISIHLYDENMKGLSLSEENKANAQLIASAPEMLEALQNLENDNGQIPAHAWKMVQNAIKKAIG